MDVETEDIAIPVPGGGRQLLRIFRRSDAAVPPVVLYVTTAGPGQAETGDASCRLLAAAIGAAVVLPELTDAPPRPGDVGAALHWIAHDGSKRQLDGTRLAVAGDGDLATLLEAIGYPDSPTLRAAVLLGSSPDAEVLRGTAELLAAALRPDVTPQAQPRPA